MQLIVIAVNAVLLAATALALDAWVKAGYRYLDVDMAGWSGVLWIPLVVLGTALAVIGFRSRFARLGAGAVLVALALILADNAFGALRDGEVSAAGAQRPGASWLFRRWRCR